MMGSEDFMDHSEPPADVAASVREAVGVFQSSANLQAAIDELLSSGFHRADLSLLANQDAVKAKLGHAYRKVQDLEDASDVPSGAYVSTEAIGDAEGALVAGLAYIGALTAVGAVVASGGTLALAIVAAAAAGTGAGSVGAMFARLIGADRADRVAEHLERGGLLLWVRTRSAAHEDRALGILQRNDAEDVHVHDLARGKELERRMAARLQELADEADRESFPASDAPSFSPSVSGGPRRNR
jgi:hypothetical protein